MNENNTVSMYEAVPAVSELNRVPGFDPLKFLRRTKDGGWKLDLKIKKLWFRLKYPTGRIKLSALKITDQLAIIEARVYLDKNDAQPVASFTAQRENKATLGGLYIEAAQHSAIDEALSSAGFGIQFIPAREGQAVSGQPVSVPVNQMPEKQIAAVKKPVTPSAQEVIQAPQKAAETAADGPAVKETPADVKPAETNKTVVKETAPAPVLAAEAGSPAPVRGQETAQAAVQAQDEQAETPAAAEGPCTYTKETPVDEIYSRMTVEEAGNMIVPVGTCKGWTLSQVADRRPVSLKWYLTGYNGDDNILRAAAKIMLDVVEAKKAS